MKLLLRYTKRNMRQQIWEEKAFERSRSIYHKEFRSVPPSERSLISSTYHPAWFRSNWIPILRDGAPWMNNDIPLIRPVHGIVSTASPILQGLAKRLRLVLRLFGRKTCLTGLSGQRNISFNPRKKKFIEKVLFKKWEEKEESRGK